MTIFRAKHLSEEFSKVAEGLIPRKVWFLETAASRDSKTEEVCTEVLLNSKFSAAQVATCPG